MNGFVWRPSPISTRPQLVVFPPYPLFLVVPAIQHRLKRFARVLFIGIILSGACYAEKGILVAQVKDIQKQAVAGVTVTVEGSAEPGISDTHGRARIKLDPQTEVNDWVVLQIKSPHGKDMVLISPWDERAQVPPFQKESVNYVPLVVANRGDRMLLENGTAMAALVAKINKANSPRMKQIDPEQQRREALETVAKTFGLTSDDVDKAIRAWGEKTEDPYEKGLAALYEKNYPFASERLAESLEVRKKNLATAQAATADAAFFLGRSKYEEGKYRESVSAYLDAQKLQPDDPTILSNLAKSLHSAGDYAGAEPLFRRALVIDEETLGSNHPAVASDLNNLGALLWDKGDYISAERLLRRALAVFEEAFGPDHPMVAAGLNNVALLLMDKGDYLHAEPLFRRALNIDEFMGSNRRDVARDLNNLAELIRQKGDYASAEQLLRRALAIDQEVLGADHPEVASGLNNLAEMLEDEQDYSSAEPLLRQALAIDEKVLGPDHPDVAGDLNNLASLLFLKGDYAAAEPLFRRALSIDEAVLGADHPHTKITRRSLEKLMAEKQKAGTHE